MFDIFLSSIHCFFYNFVYFSIPILSSVLPCIILIYYRIIYIICLLYYFIFYFCYLVFSKKLVTKLVCPWLVQDTGLALQVLSNIETYLVEEEIRMIKLDKNCKFLITVDRLSFAKQLMIDLLID